MSYIFYYSNNCSHCKKMLQTLSKMEFANSQSMHYICIDKRIKEGDKTLIELDNGDRIILPPNVKEVPALMTVTNGFKVVYGDNIYKVLNPIQTKVTQKVTNNNMVPQSYVSQTVECFDPPTDAYSSFGGGDTRSEGSWENAYASIMPPSFEQYDSQPKISASDIEEYQRNRK